MVDYSISPKIRQILLHLKAAEYYIENKEVLKENAKK